MVLASAGGFWLDPRIHEIASPAIVAWALGLAAAFRSWLYDASSIAASASAPWPIADHDTAARRVVSVFASRLARHDLNRRGLTARRRVVRRRKPYILHGHVHQQPHRRRLSGAAKTTMEKSGEQWTMMRSAVFEALASFDRPASSLRYADKVSQDPGRRVAANSVYRILDLFVGANLARRVERRQRLCRQRPSRLPATASS